MVKLLVLDVEGTLFQTNVRLGGTTFSSTIWQGIARSLGPKAVEEEVESHKRWNSGGYQSYLDWMKDTIGIHRRHGLTSELFNKLISSARYNPNALEVLSGIDRSKFELVLVTGGFRELAVRAQRDLGIFHAFAACEYFFGADGTLESYNLLPCDFEGKINFVELMLREYKLRETDWIFIGDGLNDIPIAKRAPISVGYRADHDLKRYVTHQIEDFEMLPEILNSHQ